MKIMMNVALMVTLAGVLSGCRPVSGPETGAPAEPVQPGDQSTAVPAAGDFQIPAFSGVEGDVVALNAYAGKVVLLDFWATWCPPCRYELPALNKMYGELKDRGFVLIGMTVDQGSKEKVQADVAKFGLTYPVGLAGPEIQAAYGGIRAVPTKFLLGRNGKVIESIEGLIPEEELRAKIEKALAE